MEEVQQQHKQTTHGYQKTILFSTFLWLFYVLLLRRNAVEHMLDLGFMGFLTFFTSKVVKRRNSGTHEILGSVHIWREKKNFKENICKYEVSFSSSSLLLFDNLNDFKLLFKFCFDPIHCFQWTIFHIHSFFFLFFVSVQGGDPS